MANYIDNEVIHEQMKEWIIKNREREAQGLEPLQMTEDIGRCILLQNEGMAKRPNFRNYTFIDDMIGRGVEKCVKDAKNYDYEKYKRPYTFFNHVIWWAFVDVIKKENARNDGKIAMMFDPTTEAFQQAHGDNAHISRDSLVEFYYGGKA